MLKSLFFRGHRFQKQIENVETKGELTGHEGCDSPEKKAQFKPHVEDGHGASCASRPTFNSCSRTKRSDTTGKPQGGSVAATQARRLHAADLLSASPTRRRHRSAWLRDKMETLELVAHPCCVFYQSETPPPGHPSRRQTPESASGRRAPDRQDPIRGRPQLLYRRLAQLNGHRTHHDPTANQLQKHSGFFHRWQVKTMQKKNNAAWPTAAHVSRSYRQLVSRWDKHGWIGAETHLL